MSPLEEARAAIDAVDDKLVALLAQRRALVDRVAAAKRASGKRVNDPTREEAVLKRLTAGQAPAEQEETRAVFRRIFEVSKARQRVLLNAVEKPAPSVAVVGLGLIGGSFYKAAMAAGYATRGLHHDATEGLEDADLVLVCLPPDAIAPWIAAHARRFKAGATVVDICGTKRPIMSAMRAMTRDGWTFVGGHPMAGREVSGYANAKSDLFVGASMILTPFAETPERVLRTLADFFRSVGFERTVVATPEVHDDMIAFTSQLCHVIATTYARDPRVSQAVGFSAGSYANMTRIATQDECTWSALYLANADRLLPVVEGFAARLEEFRAALAAHDENALRALIVEGTKAKRQELLDRQRGDENV